MRVGSDLTKPCFDTVGIDRRPGEGTAPLDPGVRRQAIALGAQGVPLGVEEFSVNGDRIGPGIHEADDGQRLRRLLRGSW